MKRQGRDGPDLSAVNHSLRKKKQHKRPLEVKETLENALKAEQTCKAVKKCLKSSQTMTGIHSCRERKGQLTSPPALPSLCSVPSLLCQLVF